MKPPPIDVRLKNYPTSEESPLVLARLRNGCGPRGIWSVLSYFGKRVSASRITRECGYTADAGTHSLAAAIALHRLGLKVSYYSDVSLASHDKRLLAKARQIGIPIYRAIPLEWIIHGIAEGWVPIVAYLKSGDGHLSPLIGRTGSNLIFFGADQPTMDIVTFLARWNTRRHGCTCILARQCDNARYLGRALSGQRIAQLRREGRAREARLQQEWFAREKRRLTRLSSVRALVTVHLSSEEVALQGVLESFAGNLIVLQHLKDFLPDGFVAINLEEVSIIEDEDTERLFERIFREADGYTRLAKCPLRKARSLRQVLQQLKELKLTVGITWFDSDGEGAFVLGKVTRVGNKSCSVLGFDRLCKWDEKPTICPYASISYVSFGDEYSGLLSKYVHR